MERLRYVARAGVAGAADAALVVDEVLDALVGLRPSDAELVTLCRQLVQRNPGCGPLWWLGARLLSGGLAQVDALRAELAADGTVGALADALPGGGRIAVVGAPELAARALVRRGDVAVLVADTGAGSTAFVRALDRADLDVTPVEPGALRAAVAAADLVVVEPLACSDERALVPMGMGLLAVAAASVGTPVWLVVGLGGRLPRPYLDAASAMTVPRDEAWAADIEVVDLDAPAGARDLVCGPNGVAPVGPASLAPDCPYVPELIPPLL